MDTQNLLRILVRVSALILMTAAIVFLRLYRKEREHRELLIAAGSIMVLAFALLLHPVRDMFLRRILVITLASWFLSLTFYLCRKEVWVGVVFGLFFGLVAIVLYQLFIVSPG